jgi:hypothetical protein
VECSDTVLPVTYTKFAGMMECGDTLYLGRYLVSGADSASLYLEVRQGLYSAVCLLMKSLVLLALWGDGAAAAAGTEAEWARADSTSLHLQVKL